MFILLFTNVYLNLQTTPQKSGWDETPGRAKGSDTPGVTPSARMWDATPGAATPGAVTPGRKNRWDETPRWGDTPKADKSGTILNNFKSL